MALDQHHQDPSAPAAAPGTGFSDRELTDILPKLRAYAMTLTRSVNDADDLVHDAVVRMLANRSRFVRSGPLVHWGVVVLRNVIYRRATVESSRRRALAAYPATDIAADDQEAALIARQSFAMVAKLPTDKAIVLLRRLDGETYEETAAAEGIAVGTVKSRLYRGRVALAALTGERFGARVPA